jgi:hypothetical protein
MIFKEFIAKMGGWIIRKAYPDALINLNKTQAKTITNPILTPVSESRLVRNITLADECMMDIEYIDGTCASYSYVNKDRFDSAFLLLTAAASGLEHRMDAVNRALENRINMLEGRLRIVDGQPPAESSDELDLFNIIQLQTRLANPHEEVEDKPREPKPDPRNENPENRNIELNL